MNSITFNDFLRMEIKNEAGILPKKKKIRPLRDLKFTRNTQVTEKHVECQHQDASSKIQLVKSSTGQITYFFNIKEAKKKRYVDPVKGD